MYHGKSTPLRIAVLSDTHDILRPQVKEILRSCDAAIHAGDVTTEEVMDEMRKLTNIYVVRGNNDYHLSYLRQTLSCSIAGISFLAVHDRRNAGRNLDNTQVVIFGHTHRYSQEVIGGRLWLNPGSCGRRRFSGELTMAVLTAEEGKILNLEKIEISEDEL